MSDTLHILVASVPDAESQLQRFADMSVNPYLIELRSNPIMSEKWSPLNGSKLGMYWRDYYITNLASRLRANTTSGGLRLVGNWYIGIERLIERLEIGQMLVLLCATAQHGQLVAGLVERETAKRHMVEVEATRMDPPTCFLI